ERSIIIFLITNFEYFFFFFFQAEDGIRDKLVTGVQTCALPILSSKRTSPRRFLRSSLSSTPTSISTCMCTPVAPFIVFSSFLWRSEERRVGKECIFRWWQYH